MKPSIGRIVHYVLNAQDAERVQASRARPGQTGNEVRAGQTFPMLVVGTFDGIDHVNGQVFLDGNDTLWVTSVGEGDQPGTWTWPPRA